MCDNSQEQIGKNSEFMHTCRRQDIRVRSIEPGCHNQNPAEACCREVRKKWHHAMTAKNVPERLWDYGFKWCCEIMQRTTNSNFALNGRTPYEVITGETPDISEYLDFGFYDWVNYKDNAGIGDTHIGRWLGVAHSVGNSMTYWVLTRNGDVLARSTVARVPDIELHSQKYERLCRDFDDAIRERMKKGHEDLKPDSGKQVCCSPR